MTIGDILFEVNVIGLRLNRLLDEGGRRAIALAQDDIKRQKASARAAAKTKARAKRDPRQWKLEISPGTPLSFIPAVLGGHRLLVDLFCMITEPDSTGVPAARHTIAVRVWTDDINLWYRPHLDAETVRDAIRAGQGRRVMLRFHFDYANPGQQGPRHHLQIGGGQQASEFCWFPDNLKVPRFCHHPLNLLMACEFVVRTFFPNEYHAIAQEATWRHALERAQQAYLEPYCQLQQLQITEDGLKSSLLDRLWN